MKTITDIEFLTSEIDDHSIPCDSLWHEEYGWPMERATYILDAFCNKCRTSFKNLMMDDICITYLDSRGSKKLRCRKCGSVGSTAWSYIPI